MCNSIIFHVFHFGGMAKQVLKIPHNICNGHIILVSSTKYGNWDSTVIWSCFINSLTEDNFWKSNVFNQPWIIPWFGNSWAFIFSRGLCGWFFPFSFFFSFFCFILKHGLCTSHLPQTSSELTLQSPLPECWDYRFVPPLLALTYITNFVHSQQIG